MTFSWFVVHVSPATAAFACTPYVSLTSYCLLLNWTELDDSEKYNKSVLRSYLFNTEHWPYDIYTKSNYLTVNLFEIKTD